DTKSSIRPIDDGVPAFAISSTCTKGGYRLDKLVLSDPQPDVVLQRVTFHAMTGQNADYRLYVPLPPHLVNKDAGTRDWAASRSGGARPAVAAHAACWRARQASRFRLDPAAGPERRNPDRGSTRVLRPHQANSFAGGYIASLSMPWGVAKGDEDLGGYHLVWP